MNKICSRCLQNKGISEFGYRKNSKDGHHGVCKECRNEDTKKCRSNKVFTEEEKMSEKSRRRDYYLKNKNEILAKSRLFRDNNKEYTKNYKKVYYSKNKEKLIKYSSEYHLNRLKNDEFYKFKCNVRVLIKNSIKYRGFSKINTKTFDILGCSIDDFRLYLESKFESWMTWENYGLYNGELNYGWDIDHIIPISIANTEEEVIRLNHYTNLQPMCSYFNRNIKKDKTLIT